MLSDPSDVLERLAGFVSEAQCACPRRQSAAGRRAKENFNDLAFALPGGAKETYFELKEGLVSERLASLAPLWEME